MTNGVRSYSYRTAENPGPTPQMREVLGGPPPPRPLEPSRGGNAMKAMSRSLSRTLAAVSLALAWAARAQVADPHVYTVKDVNSTFTPGLGSSPTGFVDLDGVAIFSARDASGAEPWRSDGTATGTFPLRDIRPGAD